MRYYTLHSPTTTLIISQNAEKLPEILYWGAPFVLNTDEEQTLTALHCKPVPQAFLDETVPFTLLPTLGQGDFHTSALMGNNKGNGWAPQFKTHSIAQIKNGLMIILQDEIAAFEVTLSLKLTETNILESALSIKNIGHHPYYLDTLLHSLKIPAEMSETLQFDGRWVHEFQVERTKIGSKTLLIENLKGRTSHDNPPYLIVGEAGFSEDKGCVYGFHLAWSGNHMMKLSTLANGEKAFQAGEKLLPLEISLNPCESYHAPTLLATFSNSGLNPMSHNFHNYIRESSRLAQHTHAYRPIHINTWEAFYFNHCVETLKNLVDKACYIGVERFVLDDGWFIGRTHERAALGDWEVDRNKYPNGLDEVISYVNEKGMEFGLWFEPEMVNLDSELFRKHPNWILEIPGYVQKLGRYQYVLNLDIPEASNYIFESIQTLLSKHSIGYIKWDMNRDLVQAGNAQGKPTMHKQILATYALFDRIKRAFPHVEIESCSSGGARVDMKILEYTNRFWTSDCNDAFERQSIQKGFSYFFPIELMGSHFGPEKAHSTNRLATVEYRILTAFFAHLGFEQNLLELSENECETLKTYLTLYKRYRPLLHSGDYYRIDSLEKGKNIYGVVSKSQDEALFCITQNFIQERMLPFPLKLNMLEKNANYLLSVINSQENTGYLMKKTAPIMELKDIILSGEILEKIGLTLPIMHPETTLLIHLIKI